MCWRKMRTVLSHVKFYQFICHIARLNIESFSLLFVTLLLQFLLQWILGTFASVFITMDIRNFLAKKKRELSSNSADGDERKRPPIFIKNIIENIILQSILFGFYCRFYKNSNILI